MADIKPFLNKIKSAVFGKDVRGSLHDGLEAVNKETEDATALSKDTERRQVAVENQFDDVLSGWSDDRPVDNAETISSRTNRETGEKYETLGNRLDEENKKVSFKLSEIGNKDDFLQNGETLTNKTINEFDDRGHNIRWGALIAAEDGGDWTRAIQTIYDRLKPGSKLFVPNGAWDVTNLVFDKSDIHLDIQGTFVQKEDATGSCIQIGSISNRTSNVKTEGILKVERKRVDWSVDSIGIHLINVYESNLLVDIKRFNQGFLLEATRGNGTVYNNITFLRMTDNKIGIDFKVEEISEIDRGWINENKFYGGRFGWSDFVVEKLDGESIEDAAQRLGCLHVKMLSKRLNNNIFYSTSFEGKSGKFIYCNGQYNTFYSPRLEGESIKIHWGKESLYNQVIYPYFTDFNLVKYIDEGSRNKIFGNDFIKMNRTSVEAGLFLAEGNPDNMSQYKEGYGLFDAISTRSSQDKLFRGRDSAGNETFCVNGRGDVMARVFNLTSGLSISSNGELYGGHWNLVGDSSVRAVKIAMIKNTAGVPTYNSPPKGSAVLNTADSKLYFHFGGGNWKGVQLT